MPSATRDSRARPKRSASGEREGLGAGAAKNVVAAPPTPDHVVIVIEENHAYTQIIGSSSAPYINSLAAGGALMTQSFGITHPSQPNYLDLYSGSPYVEKARDHVRHFVRGKRRADHLAQRCVLALVAADRHLVPLAAVLVDAEHADVADVMVTARVHAAGDVEVDVA